MWMPQLGQVEKLSILPTCEAAKLQCYPFFDSSFVIGQRRTGIEKGWSKGRRRMENETEVVSRQLGSCNQTKGGKQAVGEPCIEMCATVGKTASALHVLRLLFDTFVATICLLNNVFIIVRSVQKAWWA